LKKVSGVLNLGNAIIPEVMGELLSSLGNNNLNCRLKAAAELVRLAKTSSAIRPEVIQWLEQNPNHDGIGNAIDCLWSIVVE
jgi:hypothetical protein